MKKSVFIFIPFLMILFSMCGDKSPNKQIATIDSESRTGVKLSDIFSGVNVIELETADSSLVGLSIEKIEYYKGKFFVLNQLSTHRNILCFDADGKFLYTIDRIGSGPQEYTYLGTFVINKSEDLLILSLERGDYDFYDLNGNYLKRIKTADEYFERQIVYKNNDVYIAHNDSEARPEGYNLLSLNPETFDITDKSDVIKEEFYETGFPPLSIFEGNILFYSNNDTIYDISNSIYHRHPLYFLKLDKKTVLSKKNLKNRDFSDHELLGQEVSSLFSQGQIVFFTSLFENEKWISVNLVKGGEKNNPDKLPYVNKFVLYDKETGISYLSENIIFDMFNLDKLYNIKIAASVPGKLYGLLDKVFSEKEIIKIKESNFLSEKEKEILINRDISDNPVLICFSHSK
jgi:hypothetical protein